MVLTGERLNSAPIYLVISCPVGVGKLLKISKSMKKSVHLKAKTLAQMRRPEHLLSLMQTSALNSDVFSHVLRMLWLLAKARITMPTRPFQDQTTFHTKVTWPALCRTRQWPTDRLKVHTRENTKFIPQIYIYRCLWC